MCGRVLVTTQDISVMEAVNKDSTKVVKIEHGFTLEESLKVIKYMAIKYNFKSNLWLCSCSLRMSTLTSNTFPKKLLIFIMSAKDPPW